MILWERRLELAFEVYHFIVIVSFPIPNILVLAIDKVMSETDTYARRERRDHRDSNNCVQCLREMSKRTSFTL